MPEPTPLEQWAASGAMALTGRPNGPPLAAPGRPAAMVSEALARVSAAALARTGAAPVLPGAGLLGERAAVAGFRRNGPWSCGGSFRAVPTADGYFGLSLARPDDLSLVPALVESAIGDDGWAEVTAWAARCPTAEAVARGQLLGLPCSGVPMPLPHRPGVVTTHGGPRPAASRARVLDLTSLWAGPLCAHLLGLTGADVVKVESTRRLDGARSGPRPFFDLLHSGHRMVALDFTDAADRVRLRELAASSDLVLEASRPRALRQLGLHAEELVAAGTSWLSITARGRDSNAAGFGDDVAVGAGLYVEDAGELLPCGDALADPLAGVAAAAAAAEVLAEGRAAMIDVSMHHVALEAAQGGPEEHTVCLVDGGWWVESEQGRFLVEDPAPRSPAGVGGAAGADNAELLP